MKKICQKCKGEITWDQAYESIRYALKGATTWYRHLNEEDCNDSTNGP